MVIQSMSMRVVLLLALAPLGFGSSIAYAAALSPPSNLSATAISSQIIDLTWVDQSSQETGNEIERSTSATAGFVKIATTTRQVESYRDAVGLACNAAYYYRVRATRNGRFSSYSNVAGAITRPCPTPTRTVTPLRTPTRTPTSLRTATRTVTPLRTPTRTATAAGATRTATRTPTPLRTPTRTPTPTVGQPALVGFVPGLGVANDVVVSGGYAYAASAEFGVSVLDPAMPTVAGSAAEPFLGEHLAIAGNRAVATGIASTGRTHLWVLDLTDRTRPVILGQLSTTIPAGGLTQFMDVVLNGTGTLAVAALGTTGVWVIDLTVPSLPLVIGSYNTAGTAFGVALNAAGNLAYVADGASGLAVLSLANPRIPSLTGTLPMSGTQRSIDRVGNTVYLANQNGTLRIVDVTNASLPVLKGGASLTGFGYHVACEGTLCAAISGNATNDYLDLVNVANPTSPVRTGSVAIGPAGSGKGVDLVAGRAYVAGKGDGLEIYTTGGTPSLTGAVDDDSFLGQAIDARAGRSVIAGTDLTNNTALMLVLDVSAANDPEILGELGTGVVTSYTDVALNSTATMAVVTQGTAGLVTIDLANPAFPKVFGSYNSPGTAWGVKLNSTASLAYVADGASGLRIVSLANPRTPTSVGTLAMSGTLRSVDVIGTTAYLANQNGTLRIVDVSNPSLPVLRGGASLTGFGYHVACEGTLCAAISGNATNDYLDIVSVANPTSPLKLGSVVVGPAGSGGGVDLVNGRAYVAADDDGLKIYSLLVPAAPLLTGSGFTVGAALDVVVESGYARVADHPATISIVDLP